MSHTLPLLTRNAGNRARFTCKYAPPTFKVAPKPMLMCPDITTPSFCRSLHLRVDQIRPDQPLPCHLTYFGKGTALFLLPENPSDLLRRILLRFDLKGAVSDGKISVLNLFIG